MGEDGDGVSKHSPAVTRNEVSGVVSGPVVQAGSISGGVVITTGTPTQSEVDKWTEGLALGVQKLWRREEAHRRIHDPVALPVRWHPNPELADQWANIRRLPAGAAAEPLALSGSIDQLGEIYRSIPSGRLVLLGAAGSGKTVLAARLALDLLEAHEPGHRVPVIVSVGSWNPTTTPLHVWLAEQLARDHPGLAAPVQKRGPSRAAALIDADRVLPILDGFDEIDAGLHRAALRQLNTITDTPIVVTSRVEEYTSAVHGADVFTGAAVVELDDLTLHDLAAYLPRTAAGNRTGIWDPVLQRMRAEPHAPGPAMLRQVLTNPLMVFLARTIYSDRPGQNPAELLDTHQFPAEPALQDHLLAEFVPAVYQADQPGSRPGWPIDRAHRYLTYLAHHIRKAGTHDLGWWQLRDTIPRSHRTIIFALLDGFITWLMFGLTNGLAFWLTNGAPQGRRLGSVDGPADGIVYGFVVGLVYGLPAMLVSGLVVALTVGLTKALRGQRRRDNPRFLSTKFAIALGTGLGTGLASALAYGLMVGLAAQLAYGFKGVGSAVSNGLLQGPAFGTGATYGLRVGLRQFGVETQAALVAGIVTGLTAGLLVMVLAGLSARRIRVRSAGPPPSRTRLQIRGRGRFIAGKFGLGFVFGFGGGFVVEFVDGIALPGAGLADGLLDGLPFGLWVGFMSVLAFGLEAPVDAADVVGVGESLSRDRRNAIRKMLAVGLALGVLAADINGLPFGLATAVVAGFVGVRATSAWLYWLVLVRGWLPLTGRLPWRVQAFLTDAYQRGVLRQTGVVYQFRHARLQDHLITKAPNAVED